MKLLSLGDRVRRVMSEQGRDLHRHPTVGAIGPVVNRPEETSGLPQVLERKLEEECLALLALLHLLADGVIVGVRVLDRVVEDRGI